MGVDSHALHPPPPISILRLLWRWSSHVVVWRPRGVVTRIVTSLDAGFSGIRAGPTPENQVGKPQP